MVLRGVTSNWNHQTPCAGHTQVKIIWVAKTKALIFLGKSYLSTSSSNLQYF